MIRLLLEQAAVEQLIEEHCIVYPRSLFFFFALLIRYFFLSRFETGDGCSPQRLRYDSQQSIARLLARSVGHSVSQSVSQ